MKSLFITTTITLLSLAGMAQTPVEPEKKEEPVFTIVEQMPEFPGGEAAMRKFIVDNIQYPKEAKKEGIQGRVYVGFIVEPDGSLSNIRVLRDINPLLSQEAVRMISTMPKWIPGKQGGKAVRVNYNLPITFTLN